MSETLMLCKKYLGKEVEIKIDKPIGSIHPGFKKIKHTSNYGYIEGVKAPYGDYLDAYLLKVGEPVNEYKGVVVAIVHRLSDDDDKLVVIPEGETITNEEMESRLIFRKNGCLQNIKLSVANYIYLLTTLYIGCKLNRNKSGLCKITSEVRSGGVQ